MEFLKKHYEKILLSVVLLCLAGTAAWFPAKMKKEKEDAQNYIVTLPTPKELTPIDLATNQTTLVRLQNPPTVVLDGEHNLFNPVTWKVKSDGSYLKIVREGIDALTITKVTPLFMELSYERFTASGYWVGIRRASLKKPSTYAKLNEKKELFTIKEVRGETNDPTELILALPDMEQPVSISKETPYKRVEGYAVDLRYDPDNLTFSNKKINEVITFGGESYKIIAITENEVRVSAISTDKRTTIVAKGAR